MEIDRCENMADTEIDNICNSMTCINIISHVNIKLVNDLNLLIHEIARRGSFDVDIYELCVSCGNDIVWNQEYTMSCEDSEWLQKEGKTFFMNTLNSLLQIKDNSDYHKAIQIYSQICNLFIYLFIEPV